MTTNCEFDYDVAFSRNIGWIRPEEQQFLRGKRVAIAGMGGVGGKHLITLSRMGIGKFNISDLDTFEVGNFNRQAGASLSTLNRPKVDEMDRIVHEINPEIESNVFPEGIHEGNIDAFLTDVDIYVDGLDLFVLEIRRKIFARCYELGIPAITAAPMGMGTAFLSFCPGKMSFEEYFCLEHQEFYDQIVRFIVGLSPSLQQRHYLVGKSSLNLKDRKAPSTAMGIDLAAGVLCTNAIKILLKRGSVLHAPHGLHFDAYRNKLKKTWRPWGNKNPIQKLMYWVLKLILHQGSR